MAGLTLKSRVPLPVGKRIPVMGFGTYQLRNGGECEKMCREALRCGYRLIDTAACYGNEEDVEKAVRESGIPREDIFITTKLWHTDHGKEKAASAFRASMSRYGSTNSSRQNKRTVV